MSPKAPGADTEPARASAEASNGEPGEADAVLGGRYRLQREIGRGGMGCVYEARHVELGRRFAVKLMHDARAGHGDGEAHARFRREATIAAALEHEHIAAALDFGRDGAGRPYMVMEYVDGCSLAERLDEQGRLAVSETLEIARQLCSALSPVHAMGVIHRDLKPGNVMLSERADKQPWVKLLDFGVAKLRSVPELTARGAVLGTAAYMAPEQIRGAAVDSRTDVYAMGALLYRCLSGQLLHSDQDVQVLFYRILHESPVPLAELRPELPPRLAAAVMRALAREPAERFADIDALAQELSACAERASAKTLPVMQVTAQPHVQDDHGEDLAAPARRAPRWLPWLLALLIGASGLSWLALRSHAPSRAAHPAFEATPASTGPAADPPMPARAEPSGTEEELTRVLTDQAAPHEEPLASPPAPPRAEPPGVRPSKTASPRPAAPAPEASAPPPARQSEPIQGHVGQRRVVFPTANPYAE